MRHRNRRQTVGIVLTLLVALGAGGCVAHDALVRWRGSVERYVEDVGLGDPNVLRATIALREHDATRPAQAVLGEIDIPAGGFGALQRTRDAQGLLLGVRRVGSADWYIFVLGVVDCPPVGDTRQLPRRTITDVRLVAMHVDDHHTTWVTSAKDDEAVSRYIGRDAGQPGVDTVPAVFPRPADRFRLTLSGRTVIVREATSGAEWRVTLPASRAAARAD